MLIVGIDPGTNGGLALLDDTGTSAVRMPETPQGIAEFLRSVRDTNAEDVHVYIEKIPKFCGAQRFAEREIMGSSLAVLYGNYQLCVGICVGMELRTVELAPLKWQNLVGCRNHLRAGRGDWKNALKAHAQGLFPDIRVTLATADALLIAHAGRLLETS